MTKGRRKLLLEQPGGKGKFMGVKLLHGSKVRKVEVASAYYGLFCSFIVRSESADEMTFRMSISFSILMKDFMLIIFQTYKNVQVLFLSPN